MTRWSVAIEVDVSFDAPDEDTAWATAGAIAAQMSKHMCSRYPPGTRRANAMVYSVEANFEPSAILEMGECASEIREAIASDG